MKVRMDINIHGHHSQFYLVVHTKNDDIRYKLFVSMFELNMMMAMMMMMMKKNDKFIVYLVLKETREKGILKSEVPHRKELQGYE